MIQLDDRLLADARLLFNAENVDRLKKMIFDYGQAVDLHNRRCPAHEIYRIKSELKLRQYVHSRHEETIRLRTNGVIESAEQASLKSALLAETYDEMEKHLADWSREACRRVA